MKNFKIYPFQKNKYFYGKLLTVRDFEVEQKYVDEKRYMINRIMFGSGIVSGLQVIMIDEQTLSIEAGVAIDHLGREIVISSPVTKKLGVIKGFDNHSNANTLYLCLDYQEKGRERVHAISSDSREEHASEYNRTQEGYELLIKEEIEEKYLKKSMDQIFKTIILYEDAEVRIKKKHPLFINPGEVFEVSLEIEKKKKDVNIKLDYLFTSESAYALGEEGSSMKVRFREPAEEKRMHYETRFFMIAKNQLKEDARLVLKREDFQLEVNREEKSLDQNIISDFKIIEENKKERLLKGYQGTSIDERIEEDSFDYIYLAKIEVLQVESTYMIRNITPVPFEQYIYNNRQLKNLARVEGDASAFHFSTEVETKMVDCQREPDVKIDYHQKQNKFKFQFQLPKNQLIFENILTGTVDIEVNENFKFGKNFVTEEIEHGLGLGPVFVHVGIEEGFENGLTEEDERIYYGDSAVFYKSEFESDATSYSLGAMVYPNKGTFRAGLRLQSAKKGKKVRLRWWAYKNLSAINQKEQVKVIISPEEIILDKNEAYQFSGTVYGNEGDDLIWTVEGENSGIMDEFGLYTAPDFTGVYKIKAASKEDPTKSAVAMVTVKDESRLNHFKMKF